MAVEMARKCGYRKVGGLYLVGWGIAVVCDRLPLPILPCPVCGAEVRFHRAVAKIDPQRLWGNHDALLASCATQQGDTSAVATARAACACSLLCPMCYPPMSGWQMWVGGEYTPASFVAEASEMGVSKRIARLPRDCRIGEWVYLAHRAAIPPQSREGQLALRLAPGEGEVARGSTPGIFYVFRVSAVEKIVTESQSRDEAAMFSLRAAGITPVIVPDNDQDHQGR